MTALQPIPYLFFQAKCAEAFDFYTDLFGGKIVSKTTYGDLPPEMMAGMPSPDDAKSLVMNEILELPGGLKIYGGDARPGVTHAPMSGFMLALNFETVDEGQAVFDKLCEAGHVSMPFVPTFWAEGFGMVTDKFGIDWCVSGNPSIS